MDEKIQIDKVKFSDYNPRKISEKDYNNLKKSVKQFGILRPLIINKTTGNLISGHQLTSVCKDLGIKEIPVQYVELSEDKEKALNLAMNKISGTFDEDKLIDLIEKINNNNEDSLGLTGFSTEELNYLLGLKEREKEDIFAISQEDEFDQGNKYGIKLGDIIKLDNHQIICGDSADPETWHKLIGEDKIDLIVTSPPYNLNIKYGQYSDNKELKDYLNMIEQVFLNSKDFMNKGRFACINLGREWGPINMPSKYDQLLEVNGFKFFRNIYWKKPLGSARATITNRNPFPRYYIPKVRTELIMVYSNDEMPETMNAMITYKFGEGEKIRSEQIPKILLDKYSGNVWEMMTETQLGQDHPAPFPTQLSFNCIRFFSFEGEKIIDPFAGSFTTMLATQQLNRKFYGIEIDPNYISLGIERYLMMFPNAKMEIQKRG